VRWRLKEGESKIWQLDEHKTTARSNITKFYRLSMPSKIWVFCKLLFFIENFLL